MILCILWIIREKKKEMNLYSTYKMIEKYKKEGKGDVQKDWGYKFGGVEKYSLIYHETLYFYNYIQAHWLG